MANRATLAQLDAFEVARITRAAERVEGGDARGIDPDANYTDRPFCEMPMTCRGNRSWSSRAACVARARHLDVLAFAARTNASIASLPILFPVRVGNPPDIRKRLPHGPHGLPIPSPNSRESITRFIILRGSLPPPTRADHLPAMRQDGRSR